MADNIDLKKMFEDLKRQRVQWAAMDTLGERFNVPRSGKRDVATIIYRPAGAGGMLPVLFNMHGGAWVGGDAVLMESFCQLMADSIPALVVNVNYTKADVEPFPYAQYEVVDVVNYFAQNAQRFSINPARMAVGGHSAGAHIAAGAAMMLKEMGIELACQMLVYPCVDMRPSDDGLMAMFGDILFKNGENLHRWASPLFASDAQLNGLAPAIFVECGLDDLKPQGVAYAKRLMSAGVAVKIVEYPNALHGFLEVNRPDYPDDPRKTPEQASYARSAERYLINELRACFAER